MHRRKYIVDSKAHGVSDTPIRPVGLFYLHVPVHACDFVSTFTFMSFVLCPNVDKKKKTALLKYASVSYNIMEHTL